MGILLEFNEPWLGCYTIGAIRAIAEQVLHTTLVKTPHIAHGIVHTKVEERYVVEVEATVVGSGAVEQPCGKVVSGLVCCEILIEGRDGCLCQPLVVDGRQTG